MSRIYPLTSVVHLSYPEKRLATAKAELCLKGGTMAQIEDDRGCAIFVVSWASRTVEFRQLDDAERFIETLPTLPKVARK